MYAYGQRYTTTKLVTLTSNMVYEKRADLVGEILNLPIKSWRTWRKADYMLS